MRSPWQAGVSPESEPIETQTSAPSLRQFADHGWQVQPGEVQVWCLNLDAVRVDEIGGLSDEEKARANRFRHRLDRQRFLACRGILREMLGRYLSREPGELVFHYGANGKPELAGLPQEQALQFNVSHSGELALYGFSTDAEIGVDIERVRTMGDMEEMACMIFSHAEWRFWMTLPVSERPAAFFDCWTKKEAILKANGTGLACGMKSLTVLTGADNGIDTSSVDLLTSFWAQDGWRAALAAKRLKRGARDEGRRGTIELRIT